MALMQAASLTGTVALQFSTSPLPSLTHLQQLGTPTSSRGSRLSSHKQFVQFTVVDNGLSSRRSQRRCLARCALSLQERGYGTKVVQGTDRAVLEDTVSTVVDPKGVEPSFFGVFDGHGGIAVAELLKKSFWPMYKEKLSGSNPEKATASAYEEFDKLTLAQPKGLFGALRERGVGGSRCGATAATVVFLPAQGGKQLLVASNVGDSRAVLCRAGTAIQLTFDHKPDVEAERKRIEAKNPTPKKPLVVNVEGTWRVGGLLALSRAFGDAYLKDWSDGQRDGARGGFGLTAEPHVTVQTVVPEDEFIILGTDGLWEFISNEEAVNLVRSAGNDKPLEDTIGSLVRLAQERGTTDDISLHGIKGQILNASYFKQDGLVQHLKPGHEGNLAGALSGNSNLSNCKFHESIPHPQKFCKVYPRGMPTLQCTKDEAKTKGKPTGMAQDETEEGKDRSQLDHEI